MVKSRFGEFFSAAGSAEWACALDDFQLSEEAGPTWECCTTGRATKSDRLDERGLTGSLLAEPASGHGVVGCRAVPLSSQGETWGALTLYWGPSVREESILPTGIAVAAIAVRAIEVRVRTRRRRRRRRIPARLVARGRRRGLSSPGRRRLRGSRRRAPWRVTNGRTHVTPGRQNVTPVRQNVTPVRRRARKISGRAPAASGTDDPYLVADQVLARRDRSAAARDRFHAKSDRAAARLDRIVSANERVESSIDGLTGAYRRDAGLLELEHEVARAHRTGDSFVLAFVDVNNLKVRNDLHGHIAGDHLLRKIADTLRANVRSYDLVVRYGGDEFICGFPALDVNDAAERFARINEDLAASDEASVAFGLAELERGDSLTELITRADTLMYANRYQRVETRSRIGHRLGGRARSPRTPS